MIDQLMTEDELKVLLDANFYELDQVGIMQHHDAVTGTCNNATCNDYRWRIFNAISENNQVYTDRIRDKIEGMTTHRLTEDLSQCVKSNTTYKDCPTANLQIGDKMAVVAHNPSSLSQR
jgi:hypothetical protein